MEVRTVKSRIKRALNPLLDASGIYDAWLRSIERQPAWTIVTYHRIVADKRDDPFDLGMCVTLRRFEEQIAYLARRARIVPLGETVEGLARGVRPPCGAVSITFDDGYRDNLTVALPVLKHHRAPFTVFVTTGGLEAGEPFWWDRIVAAIDRTRRPVLDLAALGLPGGLLLLARPRRPQAARTLLTRLWDEPPAQLERYVGMIERALEVDGAAAAPARLTAEDVRALAQVGAEIGAHSVNHPDLRKLASGEVLAEMQASKAYLEDLCGRPVPGFAYPAGHASAQVTEAARASGFSYAVGTARGLNMPPWQLFDLKRIGMPDNTVADFKRSWGGLARRVMTAPAPQGGSV